MQIFYPIKIENFLINKTKSEIVLFYFSLSCIRSNPTLIFFTPVLFILYEKNFDSDILRFELVLIRGMRMKIGPG